MFVISMLGQKIDKLFYNVQAFCIPLIVAVNRLIFTTVLHHICANFFHKDMEWWLVTCAGVRDGIGITRTDVVTD